MKVVLYISFLLTTSKSLITLLFPTILSVLKKTHCPDNALLPTSTSIWKWCQWHPEIVLFTAPHAFQCGTLKMFGSKKWWWEQLNLLFRFSTSSPSECVGFQPPSCVRMEVVIIPFLSGMLFPYFHHHDRYLWLRGSSSSGNSSLCWSVLCLPHT